MSDRHDKTTCAWVDEHIDDYIDGDLSTGDRTRFAKHLDVCTACRREFELAGSVLNELHALPEEKCPDRVSDAVLDHVGAGADGERSLVQRVRGWRAGGTPSVRAALVSAFIVLIIVSAAVVGRMQQNRITPEEVAVAEAQLRQTLAYVGEVSRRSGVVVRNEAIGKGIVKPMRRAMNVLNDDSEPTRNDNGG